MIWECAKELANRIIEGKIKSLLASFGVFWGVFMLVVLLGAGKGIENGFGANYQESMQSVITLRAGVASVPIRGFGHSRKILLKQTHVKGIEGLRGVEKIAYERDFGRNLQIRYNNTVGEFPVVGVSPGYFSIKQGLRLLSGRWFNSNDAHYKKKTVVISQDIKQRIFGDQDNVVGQSVVIHGLTFWVAGVYEDADKELAVRNRIYIGSDTFERVFSNSHKVSKVLFTVEPEVEEAEVVDQVLNFLRKSLVVSDVDSSAFYVDGSSISAAASNSIFVAIKVFVWLIGVGTLISGVVGVSNIMNITIKERSSEIGLRKAVGASNRNIILMTLLEILLVTSIAGLLGMFLGQAVVALMGYASSIPALGLSYFNHPSVHGLVAFGAWLVLVIAGLIAGIFPALGTLSISPVDAMKDK